jgi:hypothetical protein
MKSHKLTESMNIEISEKINGYFNAWLGGEK